ncbi:MAG: hypothetical protein GX605_11285 [Chloroflexi bacterium]|nr:hypothetical protein [Chloroflexota bacterium]
MVAKDFVGIQIGAISFLDEGVERAMDTLQEKGAVNSLLIGALSWSRGNAGRAALGFPDHGKQEVDTFSGGAFWYPHEQYYRNSFLKDFRTTEPLYDGFDTLGDVAPAAHKRGMRVYPYYCETPEMDIRHTTVANAGQVVEVDCFGRKTARPCNNNPGYQGWIFSVIEDWCQSYDIDGIMWGIERQSGLKSMLAGDRAVCFCDYCRAKAAQRNIDAERAREGYIQVHRYLQSMRRGETPRDGYFVTFLRILLNYPEIFQWEKLWLESHRQLHRELAGLVKFIDPQKEVGFSIWQVINTFSPYLRAQYDYEEFMEYADWLKPIVYHVPAGVRLNRYIQSFQPGLFHRGDGKEHGEPGQASILYDFAPQQALNIFYGLLGLDEASLEELPQTGLSAEYVRRETARTVAGVHGQVPVYPGIGIGVPGGPGSKEIEPADVRAAIHAAYEGGAQGVLLSRNYSETMLKNLQAAGDALRELGRA